MSEPISVKCPTITRPRQVPHAPHTWKECILGVSGLIEHYCDGTK